MNQNKKRKRKFKNKIETNPMFKAKSMNELMKQKRHNRIDEAKSQANVQSKIIYKAISPFVLTVFMAHPSLI